MQSKTRNSVAVVAQNITVQVGRSQLLKDVTLSASPGEMVAIMGPSGSGKTTLLNIISHRCPRTLQITAGKILFNGHRDAIRNIKDFSAYIMQEDHFLEYLTVEETLNFASKLCLFKESESKRRERIDFCIRELGLECCRNVTVGGHILKGISGGQKKRLSIAVAFLPNPPLLFVDEPTSGLDAALAYDVIKSLENMAHFHGHTVLCTIHQPRSQTFALFDSLVLLRLGEIAYRGPANEAVIYFASQNFVCPEDFNPPDFFLDLLTEKSSAAKTADDSPTTGAQKSASFSRVVVSADQAGSLPKLFRENCLNESQLRRIEAMTADVGDLPVGMPIKGRGFQHFVRAIGILTHRDITNNKRNPSTLIAALGQAVVMSIVIGTIWLKVDWPVPDRLPEDPCDQQRLRNLGGGIMQSAGLIAFSAFDTAIEVVKRRPLVNREVSNGLYRREARFLSSILATYSHAYISVIIISLMTYFMIGLRTAAAPFFYYTITNIILKLATVGLAMMCGNLGSNIPMATGLLPLFAVNLFVVAGFQIADTDVPGWLGWLKAISPVRYGFQGIMRSQIQNNEVINSCLGFNTPGNYWASSGLALCCGLGFTFLAFVAGQTLNKSAGLS